MKKFIFGLLAFCNVYAVMAQKDEKVTMEQVKQECSGMPLDKRARLSVSRFTVTTSTPQNSSTTDTKSAGGGTGGPSLASLLLGGGKGGNTNPAVAGVPPTLGANLSTMLTNALQGVNCYRLLESLADNKDLTAEIDAGNGAYSGKNAPKAGKQLGAQIVVTGEVVEYSVKDKGVKVMGVGSKNKTVKIGFIIKMINPETRDIIVSREFHVQSRADHSTSVLGFISADNSDPAVAAVMEDGIVQSVQFLTKMKDSLGLTADGKFAGNTDPNGENYTEVDLKNANFTSFTAFGNLLSGISSFKSMEKSFSSGAATYTVTHKGNSSAFLDELNKKIGGNYEITGFNEGKIELTVKL
jgi:curli biogenesis system outer membrane secretion channel CsgG